MPVYRLNKQRKSWAPFHRLSRFSIKFLLLTAIAVVILIPTTLVADVIYLRDGRVLKGRVYSYDGRVVIFQVPGRKKYHFFLRKKVRRVVYTGRGARARRARAIRAIRGKKPRRKSTRVRVVRRKKTSRRRVTRKTLKRTTKTTRKSAARKSAAARKKAAEIAAGKTATGGGTRNTSVTTAGGTRRTAAARKKTAAEIAAGKTATGGGTRSTGVTTAGGTRRTAAARKKTAAEIAAGKTATGGGTRSTGVTTAGGTRRTAAARKKTAAEIAAGKTATGGGTRNTGVTTAGGTRRRTAAEIAASKTATGGGTRNTGVTTAGGTRRSAAARKKTAAEIAAGKTATGGGTRRTTEPGKTTAGGKTAGGGTTRTTGGGSVSRTGGGDARRKGLPREYKFDHRYNALLVIPGNAQVTLSAGDAMSPPVRIYHAVNDGPYRQYRAPVEFPRSGVYSIRFYAVDSAGNREAPRMVHILADGTAPVITIETGGRTVLKGKRIYSRDGIVFARAADEHSGITELNCLVNGEKVAPGKGGIINLRAAMNLITCEAQDQVENKTRSATYQVVLDRTGPEIAWRKNKDGKGSASSPYLSLRPLNFHARDTGAGLASLFLLVDGKPVKLPAHVRAIDPAKYAFGSRTHEFRLRAIDALGNASVSGPLFIRTDRRAPKTRIEILR